MAVDYGKHLWNMLAYYGEHMKKLQNDETYSRPKAAKRPMDIYELEFESWLQTANISFVFSLEIQLENLICFEESRPATALFKTPFQKLIGGRDVRQKMAMHGGSPRFVNPLHWVRQFPLDALKNCPSNFGEENHIIPF